MTKDECPHSGRAAKIAALNDKLRQKAEGGQIIFTAGVSARGIPFSARVLAAVRGASVFPKEDDPYGEHDFGVVHVDGEKLYWKVDYYDSTLTTHSDDPTDPKVTRRVLTIMLAEEY